ncbi:DinB family protein [uncultured Rummeliibacillus sp.]|uniref:DinB family protein n=1 Tax=uncultured Rummeliibacillus sp. TaxID=762292 RepID=UPI0026068C1F|nr:DinB family protein [uncultured Rummeliibacillus sp.]
MINMLFNYNWKVREEWFEWCEKIPHEELTKERIGGMKSFLHTLFHVIDCEQIWVHQMLGKPVIKKDIQTIQSLQEVKEYARTTRESTERLLSEIQYNLQKELVINDQYKFPYEKVLNHIVTHEVHHIGQLSIWAREIEIAPVNSDLLIKDI